MPDRVQAMADDFFDRLVATGGPEQKTIVYCARDSHADDVAIALNNRYARWCEENGRRMRTRTPSSARRRSRDRIPCRSCAAPLATTSSRPPWSC